MKQGEKEALPGENGGGSFSFAGNVSAQTKHIVFENSIFL